MSKTEPRNTEVPARTIYQDVVRYTELGEHRTGSKVDQETSRWIRDELRGNGIAADYDCWPLRQFQLEDCWIQAYGRRIEAFPLWHPTTAGRVPLSSRIVRADGTDELSGKIALVQFPEVMVTPKSRHAEIINKLAQAGAKAIVGCTPHFTGEVYGQNVIPPFNQEPWPIPVAMIAPSQWHVLAHAAEQKDTINFMLSGVDQRDVEARNVVGKIERGRRWIVISTPQSGWFRCAGERGAGVALFLELARWAAASNLDQSFLFLSNSGHEIGHMGIHNILAQSILPPPDMTDCWLHLGASIATRNFAKSDGILEPDGPEPESLLFCSASMTTLLEEAFANLPHLTPEVYNRNHGEIRWILEHGYDAFSLMGPQRFFHLQADGPETVDPDLLEVVAATIKDTLKMLSKRRMRPVQ